MRTAAACFVLAAAIATPGIVVAAGSSPGSHPFQSARGTIVATGHPFQVAPPDRAVKSVESSLTQAFDAKGVRLHFVAISQDSYEGFQAGTGRCLVDIAISENRTPRPFFLAPQCGLRTTHADGVAIAYSPPSVRPTVEQALSTLSR
jgi:hypothetical protein